MSTCGRVSREQLELYFYGEVDESQHAAMDDHVAVCAACRVEFDALMAIHAALAGRREAARPPGDDWAPFMRRLEASLDEAERRAARRRLPFLPVRLAPALALAAVLVIGILAGVQWERWTGHRVAPATGREAAAVRPAVDRVPVPFDAALATLSEQHFERSKLVILGLLGKDPADPRAGDWSYERTMAATLLPDTRLYRVAAARNGATGLSEVLRELELVLLQAALSDKPDPATLARLQRLIKGRDLLIKIEVFGVNRSRSKASETDSGGQTNKPRVGTGV